MYMRRKWIFIAPLAALGIIAFAAAGGYTVELLWNWLLPPIFGWRVITFWQAIGLLVLSRILFGRIGRPGFSRRSAHMSPEERERFRQRMRERCGMGPTTGETRV